jgi:hypothetical protein
MRKAVKYKGLKNFIFWFLYIAMMSGTWFLAEFFSRWFWLLIIPAVLISAKLEECLLLEEAPPMPELPWGKEENHERPQ